MKRVVLFAAVVVSAVLPLSGQTQEIKYIADTLVVQAEGHYEADPDLATLTFNVSAQEKELRRAYGQASSALQQILQLAERNGLARQDISVGKFTVFPIYDWGDKKRRVRAYRVDASVVLRVRDFSRIGPLMDDAVESGIADFRSLTYSLADEEAAKQRAVAEAMQRAEGRARAALGDAHRLGALRYVSLDVKQPVGIVHLEAGSLGRVAEGLVQPGPAAPPPPLPPPLPEKIRVTASVQCVFQLQ